MSSFKKAQRHKLKVNMLVTGGSGAGKTVGALLTAKGIVQELNPGIEEADIWTKIAVIDTEHERALFRANMTVGGEHIGEFLHLNFEAPYDSQRLVSIFDEAKKMGVQVMIVDSLAHFWGGEGGLLDIHEQNGGQFKDWVKTNKTQKVLLDLLTDNPDMHTIVTSRVKQDIAMEPGDDGKMVVKKKGLKAEIRDGWEYEFAISVQVDHYTHELIVMKDNSELIAGREDKKMSPELGRELVRWADQGVDVVKERQERKVAVVQEIAGAYKEPKVKQHVDKQLMLLKKKTIMELSMTQLEKIHQDCQKLLKSS